MNLHHKEISPNLPRAHAGHGFGHRRRFFTEAEKVEKLKNYAEELKKELVAVEEYVKKLQS